MKIKKLLFLGVCIFLLCVGLVGCVSHSLDPEKLSLQSNIPDATEPPSSASPETERPTEAATNASTEAPTGSPTEEMTEAMTEAPTEAMTEVTTESPEELEAKKQAMMKEIYDATDTIQLPIGGWSTPASALRDGYTGKEGSYDKVFDLIASSGINYMITLEEWSSGSWPLESLSSAHKAGIKLWYNCVGQSAEYSLEKINALLSSEHADALSSIYVKDEPTLGDISELAELTAELRAGLGVDFDRPVFSNLLPTYASSGMIGKDYRAYVRSYLDAAKPDRLMFDYYPYQAGSGDSLPAMIANIAMAREEADKDGIELYTYIQSSANPSLREPNFEELNLNAHLNLAMGVKGIAYFLVCEHYDGWDYTNMIDYEGNPTPMYDKIKAVNEGLNAMKGVYLAYDFDGLMLANCPKGSTALTNAQCTTEIRTHENGYLASVTAGSNRSQIATGCFTHTEAEGEAGYYLVNLNYKANSKITLTFSEAVTYQLWGSEGLEDMGNISVDADGNYTLSLTLSKGEGIFLKVSKAQ